MDSLCSSCSVRTRVSLFLFLLYCFQARFSSSQRYYESCRSEFRCGNFTVGFPFWGGERSISCGHQRLRLGCDQNTSMAVLELDDVQYNVLSIENGYQSLRLARNDYFSGSICSPTLDPSLFEFDIGYKTLVIFYGCKTVSVEGKYMSLRQVPLNFTCPGSGLGSLDNDPRVGKDCSTNVNVTVPEGFSVEETATGGSDVSRLGDVLKEGFVLKFSKELESDYYYCQECVASGGVCGYRNITQVCACGDGSAVSRVCAPSSPLSPVSGPVSSVSEPLPGKKARESSSKLKLVIGLSSSALAVIIVLIVSAILWNIRRTRNARKSSLSGENIEGLIVLKRYSYAEVKRLTNSFAHILGRGGFGTVYKGKLPDGRDVAMKILKESKGNDEDFINEVASMSRTSHVNIVSLLGLCYEGNKRAIIYDFVPNGSLDKFISEKKTESKMGWKEMYGVAVGVASGLEYLHNRCITRIVHFDIKPQNILLDEDLCPKISDFGLAKLWKKKESVMSLMDARGTIGYIAPEVFSKNFGGVSHKSDVYSYGMVVLEMIGAKNNCRAEENNESNDSSMYFPDWIYKDLVNGKSMRILGDGMIEEEEETVKKMALVGMWCIQTNPLDRPPMSRVVEMLEGSVDALVIPPKPTLCCSTVTAVPETLEETPSSSEQSQL